VDLLRCAYSRVSTSSGEQLAALVAQRSRLEAEAPDLILEDVESGKNPQRPGYQQLRRLIAAGKVQEVLATAFSRLGRNATESDDFVRLCDQHQVVCRTIAEGVLTMATPEDLLMTRLRGSLSEGESMRLSMRVHAGLAAGRAMGKPMRKPCWGYRLTSDRSALGPDPLTFPRAQRFIALLRRHGWRMMPTLRAFDEPTPLSSCRAVRAWLMNPTLRGGIGYHQQANHTYQTILWDRHLPLLSHADHAEFEAVAQQNRRLWGHNSTVIPRLLTGLCICAECGFRMKYVGGRAVPSVRCNGDLCSQRYRSTREEKVVLFAVDAIAREAAVTLAAAVERKEPPEAGDLRRQIAALEQLMDPDLEPVLEVKRRRLEEVIRQPPVDAELARKVADPRWHMLATAAELRVILQRLVIVIVIARQEPTAIRLRL
jgi:DNA invertase Pin-like site-specific DNA recombinase